MKRKDELKSDIVSSIDETILERVAQKRMAFMFGGRRRRQKKIVWISSIAAAACFCILASTLLWQFLPIASGKQVPIYQGMSISSEKQFVKEETADPDALQYTTLSLDSWYADSSRIELLEGDMTSDTAGDLEKPEKPEKPGNNGNHFGHNKKPIEDLAEDSLKVEGAVEKIYYAQPNQDIYITIHVSNPDNFEILSFTLNEKKYSSYMFEEGSDMENLILKVNVGDVEGMVEYTIDAIKYVDGTEIKDVVMEGDKTVQCGVYTENQPTAEVTNEVVGINKLTLTVNMTDPLKLISLCGGKAAFVLSDGEQVISMKELAVGEEVVITVDNLLTDSDYEYAIVALYDPLDGDGMRPVVLYSKQIHTEDVVAFDAVTVTPSGIQFAYVWNDAFENKVLTSATLYKGEEKVQELALDATSIDGLLSDNAYSIVISYENMGKTESVTLDFTTKAKTVPTLSLEKGTVEQESFDFTLTYTDPDSVGAVTKIELLHGEDEPIVADTVDVRAFANLLSDNEYTVRATVTYDLNNGNGEQTFSETLDVKTKAKTVPTVKFSEMNVTKYALTGRYDITDLDGVLLDKTIALYQGETAIKTTNSEGELSFSDLEDYTDYTVKVTYTYDLTDGKGEQSGEKSHSIKTLPYIDVASVSVRNTSALFEGDTIFLQAALDNPHNATITALTVNGKRYAATSFSTTALSEITVDESLGGGEVDLTVESVTLTLDGKSYTVACDTLCSADVFINGKFEFIGWDFVNAAHESINALIPGEETYFRIKLNNPTDYTLDSVTVYGDKVLKGDDLIKMDQNTYLCPVTFVSNEEPDGAENAGLIVMMYGYGSENNAMQVHALSYSNEYVNSTLDQVEERYRSVYVLRSNEIRKVSSVEDLYNMDEHIRYELTCDIDLAGVEWKSVPFSGMLNGNGYAIKNMSFVGTVNDVNGGVSLGLFSSAIGLIENLHIKNAFTFVSTSTKEVMYGAIAARAEHLVLKNCSVDAASSVLITTSSYGCVGGFVGASSGDTVIENCVNHSALSVNATDAESTTYIGGIIGLVQDHCSVVSCVNDGMIGCEGVSYGVGGIVGCGNGRIENCTNASSISVTADGKNSPSVRAGGICGIAGYNLSLLSCVNTGNVTVMIKTQGNSSAVSCGGIVGYTESGCVIVSCSNYGDISGDTLGAVTHFDFGGIVGTLENATIRNCLNHGNITSRFWTGGIVGVTNGSDSLIENCLNLGTISGTYTYSTAGIVADYEAWVGGQYDYEYALVRDCVNIGQILNKEDKHRFGIAHGGNTVENSYAIELHKSKGETVSQEQLQEKSFWRDTLGWDEAIWNFDDLDPSSGKYPTLR